MYLRSKNPKCRSKGFHAHIPSFTRRTHRAPVLRLLCLTPLSPFVSNHVFNPRLVGLIYHWLSPSNRILTPTLYVPSAVTPCFALIHIPGS